MLGLPTLIALLPKGQRQVAWVLIGGKQAPTYRQVAAKLGVHVGTVYQHLLRIRENAPTLCTLIMEERRRQLAVRHEQALKRAKAHSPNGTRKRRIGGTTIAPGGGHGSGGREMEEPVRNCDEV